MYVKPLVRRKPVIAALIAMDPHTDVKLLSVQMSILLRLRQLNQAPRIGDSTDGCVRLHETIYGYNGIEV